MRLEFASAGEEGHGTSHADNRRAWRRELLTQEIQAVLQSDPSGEEIQKAAERLLALQRKKFLQPSSPVFESGLAGGRVANLMVANRRSRPRFVAYATPATQPRRRPPIQHPTNLFHRHFGVFFRNVAACSDTKPITTNAIVK